jgi:hypothetical protein
MQATPCSHPRCKHDAQRVPNSRIDIPDHVVESDCLYEYSCPDGHQTIR